MEWFAHARRTRGLAVAASLSVAITCASPTSPDTLDSRSNLLAFVRANTVASITVALAQPLIAIGEATTAIATIESSTGRTLNGRRANWTSANPAVATVSLKGSVRGVGAGATTIRATLDGVVGEATITVDEEIPPTPAVATQLAITAQPSDGATGVILGAQPVIEVRDVNSALVGSSNATVTAVISSGLGVLGGTTAVAAVNGVATFTNLSISGSGLFTLTFTSSGLTSATSNPITISPPPATQLAMVAQPSSTALSGTVFAAQPAVALRDAANQPVRRSGVIIAAAIASAVGTLGGTTAAATDSNGVATFTNLSITGAGTFLLTFTSSGLTSATSTPVTISVPPPPATQLAMVTQPSSTVPSGAVFSVQPAVALRDAANQPVSQAGILVTAAIATGGGTLGGTTTVATNGSGVASFTNLSITGTAGDRTLRFTTAGLTAAISNPITITVATPPPSGSRVMLFQSDWRTATGTSETAVMDGGRWTLLGGQGLEVIPSTGLGFPTANVLKVNALTTTSGFALLRRTGLPVPATGESRFYRFYFQYTGPDGQLDRGSHPVQDGNAASDANIMFNIYHDGSQPNTWSFAWWPGNGIQPAAENRRFKLMADLAKGVTYRVEFQIQRISATEFNLHARVYDAAGTLLYDDDDFRGMDGLGTTTLANLPRLIFHNPANLEGLNAGNNGGSSMYASDYPHLYGYQAGFAVCGNDWCGPYVTGESP